VTSSAGLTPTHIGWSNTAYGGHAAPLPSLTLGSTT
jgi:hypothetical protein